MEVKLVVNMLEREWEQPDGFLGKLRMGVFDEAGNQRLLSILREVELGDERTLDRRFVALAWYIPLFMSWQRERVAKNGGNVQALEVSTNQVQSILESILGIP